MLKVWLEAMWKFDHLQNNIRGGKRQSMIDGVWGSEVDDKEWTSVAGEMKQQELVARRKLIRVMNKKL